MESRYGPMGLRQEYTYDEVMRAISEKPLKLDYPKRIGLRTYEDIFFNNLINDGMAYQGEPQKSGFYHDMPRQPPSRPDVFLMLMMVREAEVEGAKDREVMAATAKVRAIPSEGYQ